MQPFLKWAGGKRWLFTSEFASALPPHERYIEPFLGGGAGFFALKPQRAILADVNEELINVYLAIRDFPCDIAHALRIHQNMHSAEHYYKVRQNSEIESVSRAARTLYLNRTCWNGLYRLNRKGQFNVPVGTKSSVMLDSDDFVAASDALSAATIQVSDFSETISVAKSGDLVFVDPPYTVMHNLNGFVKYNENIFRWEDQVRLRDAIEAASRRGASIIMTNADHSSVRSLYDGIGAHEQLSRRSVISGKSFGRTAVTELMVRL